MGAEDGGGAVGEGEGCAGVVDERAGEMHGLGGGLCGRN